MLTRLKLWGAAFLAFMLALFSAKYYKGKAKRLEKKVKQEKHKVHNLQTQHNAIKRKQAEHLKEIEDATKDDSYLDYFDKS